MDFALSSSSVGAEVRPFPIGDRVALRDEFKVPGSIFPRTHGVVVWWHRTEHDPLNPRVRWADGWGTTMEAAALRPLTAEELKQPAPRLCECDLPL